MTIVIVMKDKRNNQTTCVVTSQGTLHKTFWGRKENFPTSATHSVTVNGFVIPEASQDKIANAFNTPDMDFGKTFEHGYWELFVLCRQSEAFNRSAAREKALARA